MEAGLPTSARAAVVSTRSSHLLLAVVACAGALALFALGHLSGRHTPHTHVGGHLWIGLDQSSFETHHASEVILTCTPAEALQQAAHFKTRILYESHCCPHVWLQSLQGLHRHHQHVVLVDIGCNQGFHSAEMFDVFAPELGMSKRALFNVYQPLSADKNTSVECPQACKEDCDSVNNTPLLAVGGRHVEVLCFEPSDVHFARLTKARAALFPDSPLKAATAVNGSKRVGRAEGTWHIVNAAVSAKAGATAFTSGCDSELCHIEAPGSGQQYKVQVVNVDGFLARAGNPQVTFMKIDTEGFDALVLEGAVKTFESKAVAVVGFEYHGKGYWLNVTLQSVVTKMEAAGYACYFEGNHQIFKLSSGCWDPAYEVHNWSNVVCGVAGGQYELLLDAFSYLRQMKMRIAASSLPR